MKIRASELGRQINCHLSRFAPKGESSPEADRGTEIHKYLPFNADITNLDGEAQWQVETARKWLLDAYPHEFEWVFPTEELHSEIGGWLLTGTPDCWTQIGTTLIVADLKTGRIPVQTKTNWQLMAYGVLLADKLRHHAEGTRDFGGCEITQVKAAIIQPFAGDPEWRVADAWSVRNRLQAELIAIADNPYLANPGEQCKYCENKPACISYKANESAAIERYGKDDISLFEKALALPLEQIPDFLGKAKQAKGLIEDLETAIKQRLTAESVKNLVGKEYQLEMKTTKGRREISDIQRAYYNSGLTAEEFLAIAKVSPTDLEKAYGDKMKSITTEKLTAKQIKAHFEEAMQGIITLGVESVRMEVSKANN